MSRRKQKNKPKRRRARHQAQGRGAGTATATAPGPARGDAVRSEGPEQLRFARRLRRARPRAAPEELPEDVAIWDVSVRESLPGELGEQAAAIAEALSCLADRRDAQALQRVEDIPRSSPYSDWRLFVRGLAEWYAGQYDSAHRCWQRLDASRRPARIAEALRLAENGEAVASADDAVGRAARLVRRLRFERPWVAEAERESGRREEAGDMLIGPKTAEWLVSFRTDFRMIEPEFVRALELAALERAFHQPYSDLFEWLAKLIQGPAHDPLHRLLRSRYHEQFKEDRDTAAKLRQQYLMQDLPKAEGLREPLRRAIESLLRLEEAKSLSAPPSLMDSPFEFLLGDRAIPGKVEEAFCDAIEAYPRNKEAHTEYIAWLRHQLEAPRIDKLRKRYLEYRLESVMDGWSEAIPEDVEPRLWLVEHYLEEDRIEEAEPHVARLQQMRQESPRVRALPWRYALMESMRYARRKSWLDKAQRSLERAEALWPAWLDRTWLGFLRAALALRGADKQEYQRRRAEAAEACVGPVTADTMMFAAAQRMRVPAKDLRPLREAVNHSAKNARSLPLSELLALGAFFWDLSRTNLMYPGYRAHGSKFGRELMDRLSYRNEHLAGDDIAPAALWAAEYRFWSDSYELSVPHQICKREKTHAKLAASVVRGMLLLRWPDYALRKSTALIDLLRSTAQTETDPSYRHLFLSLIEEAEAKMASGGRRWGPFGGGGMPWDLDRIFESEFDEDFEEDEDDFDDGPDFDPYCDCPRCRANRARAAKAGKPPATGPWDDDDEELDEEDFEDDMPMDLPAWARMSGDPAPPPSLEQDAGEQSAARSPAESRKESLKQRRRRNPRDPKNKRRGKGRRN